MILSMLMWIVTRVNGVYQQVFVAARELNIKGLPASAQNWINEHLKYTHGYGAVMSPAAQDGEEPFTWFLHDLPPQSDYGFKIQQPGIYYGLKDYGYAIAPNNGQEFDYSLGNNVVSVNYRDEAGSHCHRFSVSCSSLFYFKEKNIVLPGQDQLQQPHPVSPQYP